jgi:hypothetical protein
MIHEDELRSICTSNDSFSPLLSAESKGRGIGFFKRVRSLQQTVAMSLVNHYDGSFQASQWFTEVIIMV